MIGTMKKDMLVSNFHLVDVTLTSLKLCYYSSNIIMMSTNMIYLIHRGTKIYKGKIAIVLYIYHID